VPLTFGSLAVSICDSFPEMLSLPLPRALGARPNRRGSATIPLRRRCSSVVEQLFRKHRQAQYSPLLSTETAAQDPFATQRTQHSAQQKRSAFLSLTSRWPVSASTDQRLAPYGAVSPNCGATHASIPANTCSCDQSVYESRTA